MERPLTRGFPGFQLQFATSPLASPGGTVESAAATPEDTLHREATEEAQPALADPVRPGWVLDMPARSPAVWDPTPGSVRPHGVTAVGPAAVDPATGPPSPACSRPPGQPRQPPCWDGARPARGSPAHGGHRTRAVGPARRAGPSPSRRPRWRGCG
ncbi:NUDIX domain-containing protein [Streptomyces rubrogriseus]|uniref:NUDIX domain-containing protein n=1 Tax=Streptomyces rubrogriseus TaxID=194673 RepID=UPI0037D931DD